MALSPTKILGVGLGLGVLWYYLRERERTGVAASGVAGGVAPTTLYPSLSTAPTDITSGPTGPSAAAITATVGKTVTGIVGAINPVAGAFVGAATAVGTVLASILQGKPPEPVRDLLVMEAPVGYLEYVTKGGGLPSQSDWNAQIYEMGSEGLLYPIDRSFLGEFAAGERPPSRWLTREVVLVNWKIFSMMKKAATANVPRGAVATMNRPTADYIRSFLGNDAIFWTGDKLDSRGPWEKASIPPAIGSPAHWAQIAGDYVPTKTASPGEY